MLMTIFLLIVLGVAGLGAIPLLMGIVPPNPYYGWPTRSSRSKPELWTQVNRFLGRAVVIAVLIAVAALMYYNGTWLRSGFAQLLFVLVVIGIVAGSTFLYCRRLGG
jgi:uncharacterized membrane protein